MRIDPGLPVDFRLLFLEAPDHIGPQADDREAPAHAAAFDGFQQEGIGPALRQLHHRRDRGLQIGNKRRPDNLWSPVLVSLGERGAFRGDLHQNSPPLCCEEIAPL